MLGVGGVLAEAVADVAFRLAPIDRGRRRRDDRRPRHARRCSARSAASRPSTAPRSSTCCRAVARWPTPSPTSCRSTSTRSIVERRRAGRRRRARRAASVTRAPTAERVRGAVRPARRDRRRRVDATPASSASSSLHNILASGYEGSVFATNRRRRRDARRRRRTTSIECMPDGAADLVFVCTPAAANPTLAARRAPRKGVPGGVRDVRRLRRGGRRGPPRRSRAGRPSPTSSASCSPGRTARASCPRRRRSARRSWRPYPPRGPHRHRQPVRQHRVDAS